MLAIRPTRFPSPYSVSCSPPRRTLPTPLVPAPRRRPLPFVVAAAGQREDRRIGEDDYHSTVRSLNSRGRHKPRKSLGQHYMLNSSINEELVNVADVGEGDVVLEIGPGTGSLTNVLINAGAMVVAVEKDPHMALLVQERFGATGQLLVLQEDFTKCHICSHLTSFLEKNHMETRPASAKVVSNLPFNISTEVIKQLLPMGDIFSDVVLLLQDETASRLAECSLRTPEYRPINIFVQFYSDPEYKFKVERTNFFPQPNVDAAIIKFRLKQSAEYPLVTSRKSFFSMISSAFNGKRKMLRNSLQCISPSDQIEAALSSIGHPVTARPGELTMEDFVNLHNLIAKV
ncbi:ribosomal RNA small subunit methyltransferase, chloroplastic [Curcuma longa]|uniref:ribosomal RNA small subunit methyltransferase, chloroplastic n=1 Tax=Curcuma longa TaxID=136217 RepID=UPI003D9FA870